MIGIIKTNDLRNYYISKLLTNYNFIFSDNINDFLNIKTLVIPPIGITSDYYFKDSSISLLELYKLNPGITKIITCLSNKELKDFCSINNIDLVALYDIEDVVFKNAFLTSEGLIKVILNDLENISLSDLNILILGYGYCAYSIISHLKVFNNNLYVYAKDYHDLKTIYMNNYNKVVNLDDLSKYDIIINTIPYVVVDEEKLKTTKADALIYDIASYPYGFDLASAKNLGIKISILPQIPGKMLGKSASKVLFEEIIKKI